MARYAEMNIQDSAFMGLEYNLSDTARQETMHRRETIRRAVLSEQRRQRHVGIYDPDEMASISEAESTLSRRRAGIIGLLHAVKR